MGNVYKFFYLKLRNTFIVLGSQGKVRGEIKRNGGNDLQTNINTWPESRTHTQKGLGIGKVPAKIVLSLKLEKIGRKYIAITLN